MTEAPYWTAYTALFSSAAAMASAIGSFVAYRRTRRLKETDLRLELQKLGARVEADLDTLADSLGDARSMREGDCVGSAEEFKADRLTFRLLLAEGWGCVDPDSLRALKLDELEEAHARIHALQARIDRLMRKYRPSTEVERQRVPPAELTKMRRGAGTLSDATSES